MLAQPSSDVLRVIGTTPTMSIEAGSTAGNLPRHAPRNLIDRNEASFWVAAFPDREGDIDETITLRWSEPRTIDELRLVGVAGHRFPDRIRVRRGQRGPGSCCRPRRPPATFAPVTTDAVELALVSTSDRITGDAPIRSYTNPFALAEIEIPALDDLVPGTPNYDEPIVVDCDDGPSVRVHDEVRQFSVSGVLRDLVDMRRLRGYTLRRVPGAARQGSRRSGRAPDGIAVHDRIRVARQPLDGPRDLLDRRVT